MRVKPQKIRFRSPVKVTIVCFCYVSLFGLGWTTQAAADYCAAGQVGVSLYWNVSQGIVGATQEVKCVDAEVSVDLFEELTGPNDNTAGADTIACLPMAWQRASGSGITPGLGAGIASGHADSQLKDRIIFTVPAGTYSQDVIVGMRGRVSGTFTITYGGYGRARYSACFTAGNCVGWTWEDEDGWAFSRNYYLPYRLVAAGTTLTQPRVRSIALSSSLSIRGQSHPHDASSGYSEIACAFHILSPPNITWTSESGAFGGTPLSQGDNDFDGDVDGSDLAAFIGEFGRQDCAGDCDADFDYNGMVDDIDLLTFANDFGMAD